MRLDENSKTSNFTPYFSVIIPTLNEGKRIGRLLKSLKRQSFTDFETIIVDAGSKDNTIKVAKIFSAKIFVKKGCKEFPSRNFGALQAKGRILLFLSADVFLPKDVLKRLEHEFNEKKLSGICGMGLPVNAPLWMKIEYLAFWRVLHIWTAISKDFHGSTNFMAARKEDFHEMGGFVDEFCADTLFFNKLGRHKQVKMLSGILVYVSGRRAKKMGLLKFNAHFLWVILFDYIPFLRNTSLLQVLQNYSSGYRAKHG